MIKDKKKYWAKSSGETLLKHSLHTAHIARLVCAALPISPEERSCLGEEVAEIGALHDIGKAAEGFQKMVKSNISWNGKRHEILSAAIASRIAPQLQAEKILAIITHHQSIPNTVGGTTYEKCLPDNQLPFLSPNIFESMVLELEREDQNFLGFLIDLSKRGKFNWQIENLDFHIRDFGILEKYWLSRKLNGQTAKASIEQRKYASLLRGLLITSDHLASGGQKRIPHPPILKDYNKKILSKELKGAVENILPFQEKCGRIKGSAILKAPTGSGKTLAMLLWAANNQPENGRLFYTLPYTASINAMYTRLCEMYPKNSVGILHHRNAAFLYRMLEDEHSANAGQYAKSLADLAKEMYYPIKVLTPHQILKVVLRGKGWELGLVEFQNACVIFDEIHAFEPKIVGLIVASAKWLQKMGAKLLFASATMPEFLEQILVSELQIPTENIIAPNPANEKDAKVCNLKRHRVTVSSGSLLENLDVIIKDIQDNPKKKVLIVCNYVATSQEIAKTLEKESIEFCLLHARFNSDDRFKIEKKITDRDNPPRVLVATQAVEVSLDIDYDCGYTEPAPIDALAQRFGRINRKGEKPIALVTVFEKQSVETSNIYDKEVVEHTILLLREVDELSEQDLVEILNKVYINGYKEGTLAHTNYIKGLKNDDINDFDNKIIAGTYCEWVETLIEKTDEQVEVLPHHPKNSIDYLSEFKRLIKQNEFIAAKGLLVSVRIGQFHQVLKQNLVKKNHDIDEYTVHLPYSKDKGLDLQRQTNFII